MTNNKKPEFCKCYCNGDLSTGGGVILYHKKFTYPSCPRQQAIATTRAGNLHTRVLANAIANLPGEKKNVTGGVCKFFMI